MQHYYEEQPLSSAQEYDTRKVSNNEDIEEWVKELLTPKQDKDGAYYYQRIDTITVLPFPQRQLLTTSYDLYTVLIVHHRVYLAAEGLLKQQSTPKHTDKL